jgi:hypothetical protein
MPIEFRVRVPELQNAVDQLLVNRDKRTKKRDMADLLVSEAVATMRTTGSSAEMPVKGVAFGAARVPLVVLEQMAEVAGTYDRPDIQVTVSDGLVQVGTWKTKSAAIKETKLEAIPDFNIDLPVDASVLETLGLASLLSEIQIADQGLTKRVKYARQQAEGAIESAALRLVELGVSADQIRRLVNLRIDEAGARVAKTLESEKLRTATVSPRKKNQTKLFD